MATTTQRALRSPFLEELQSRLLACCDRAAALAGELSPAQLNWKPGADQWSVAQCLDHLSVGADLYAEKLRPAIEKAHERGRPGSGMPVPRHTLTGRLILSAVEPTARRRASAPGIFRPAQSEIGSDVVKRFIRSQRVIARLMADSDGLDLGRVKLSSPVARIIRINLADAFRILVEHAERHLNQAERIVESDGFPR